eukprot:g29498.t1
MKILVAPTGIELATGPRCFIEFPPDPSPRALTFIVSPPDTRFSSLAISRQAHYWVKGNDTAQSTWKFCFDSNGPLHPSKQYNRLENKPPALLKVSLIRRSSPNMVLYPEAIRELKRLLEEGKLPREEFERQAQQEEFERQAQQVLREFTFRRYNITPPPKKFSMEEFRSRED